MRHAREDYAPIIDPRPNGIPDDEPVWLLRAQDVTAAETVRFWADAVERRVAREMALADGSQADVPTHPMVALAREHADRMDAYREERLGGGKVPDMPEQVR